MLSGILALIGAITGGWAARNWYLSAQAQADLPYHLPKPPGDAARRLETGLPSTPETANSDVQREQQIVAICEAMNQAAELNRQASLWTVSVRAMALSALAGLGG
ncbi:MAG: hypothetical protein U1E70_27985 [Acetobacteraceae bacterium]|nr:hypothetical protein [Pseudomonadota bacterium]